MIWFWFFMLVSDLLVPCMMIGFGKYFSKKAPQKINSTFGYRTSRSMKNKATWEFAHQYIGRLWRWIGWILLALSLVPLLAVLGKDIRTVGNVGSVICGVQLIPLVGSIIPTELALKKTFDRYGRRKNA